jgi:DNA ligase-1
VEFAALARTFSDLEQTRSRLALVDRLATLLRAVASPEEIGQICYLVQGRVAPFFVPLEMGMADKTVAKAIALAYQAEADRVAALYRERGDLGVVAEQVHPAERGTSQVLSISEAFARLYVITHIAGRGAIEQRIALLAELLARVDGLSARYIVRVVLGKLRLGVGDATVLEALATARWHDAKQRAVLEGAYNRTSDLGLIARTLWEYADAEEARRAVIALSVQVGKPIRAELAERLPTTEAIIARLGPVLAQYKYDGFRVQIHKAGRAVSIFSRNLEDLSHMFPELIAGTLEHVQAESAILDGEALAYQAVSEEFLPFQETTRRRRKHDIAKVAQEVPLKAFVFDLLYKDGVALLDVPLEERLHILAQTLRPAEDTLMLTRSQLITDAPTLTLLFDEAITKGLEGLVVKRPQSHYEAGARNFNWVKIKRHAAGALDDTVDCVVLGYLVGRGKRAALGAGALLVGVYNSELDRFETVTKIGTGLSDAQWRGIAERTRGLEVDHRPARVVSLIEPSVWLQPALVVEVLADEITRSPTHTAGKVGSEPGYALRFPRLVSFRDADKKPEDATTVQELVELYRNQGKKSPPPAE